MSQTTTKTNLIDSILGALELEQSNGQPNADITAEDLLLASEVKMFLDQIPGGFFIYEAHDDEKIIYANQAILRIFGCETAKEFKQLTRNSFKGIVHPDDLDKVERSIEEQISSSMFDLDYVEYRITRKDGSIRWVEDYGHFVHNDVLGNIFYVFITDATEKIEMGKAERARLLDQTYEKDKRIERLIEEYDNERKIINREHLCRLEIIEVLSRNFESILYVDLDEMSVIPYRVSVRTEKQFDKNLGPRDYLSFVADYVATWVQPDDKEAVAKCLDPANVKQQLSQSTSFFQNYSCLCNGEVQQIQLRIVGVGQGLSQFVIGYRDITTEMHQSMQQHQLLSDALEHARQAASVKDIFLSNMSHDMRTPLNAIYGYTKLAKQSLNDPAAVKEYLKKIESAAGNILESVEKVLALSNMESHNNSVNEEEFDLCKLLDEVRDSLLARAVRKNVELSYDCTAVEHVNIVTDREKLKQILWQLADNAIKYNKSNGKAAIVVEEINKNETGNHTFTFAVIDTGIGIGEKMQQKLFKPFEREFNTTAVGEFGTGLGLTLAQNFVDMLGGDITVNSAVGKGTTVKVTLKLTVVEKETTFDVNTILEEIAGKKILIVDDNELNMEIESELLKDIGFETEGAENGQIAIEKLTANPANYYAVVLMDIQMPVMDGREATRRIRQLADPKLSRIPIIAVSANSFEADKRLSLQAGLDAHLPKPMDLNQLVETMFTIIANRKKQS